MCYYRIRDNLITTLRVVVVVVVVCETKGCVAEVCCGRALSACFVGVAKGRIECILYDVASV